MVSKSEIMGFFCSFYSPVWAHSISRLPIWPTYLRTCQFLDNSIFGKIYRPAIMIFRPRFLSKITILNKKKIRPKKFSVVMQKTFLDWKGKSKQIKENQQK